MADKIYPLNISPGIQRDGTRFASRSWVDGEWVRFQRGLPQKMGGYRQIGSSTEISRGTFVLPLFPNFNVYYGTASSLNYVTIDQFGDPIAGPVNRTPVPFLADVNNDWQFDTMFSTIDDGGTLIAFAAPNLASINSDIERPIYYGDQSSTSTLLPTGHQCSGGIAVFHPLLFFFGNDGGVSWTHPNDPTTVLGTARPTSSKICFGLPTRGGTNSPAGLLWSLDSLIRVTNVGNDYTAFNFDTVTSESSLLSSRGIIEMDGNYYWPATDRFLMYNGVVQEVPNDKNINYFFKNINYAQRQKVWATKITQFGEIIYHFPFGDSTECNASITYNTRERIWYDTVVNRSDGYFDETFSKPIWADNEASGGVYPLWMQETGYDQVFSDGRTFPIKASITTSYLSWMATGVNAQRNETDAWTELTRVEPDMIQNGEMSLYVSGNVYARSTPTVSSRSPYIFLPNTEKIDMREQERELLLTFTSDTVGGYFEMGQTLLVGKIGDKRQ